jgi:hypothetical protein
MRALHPALRNRTQTGGPPPARAIAGFRRAKKSRPGAGLPLHIKASQSTREICRTQILRHIPASGCRSNAAIRRSHCIRALKEQLSRSASRATGSLSTPTQMIDPSDATA